MVEPSLSLVLHSLGANFGLCAVLILLYNRIDRSQTLPPVGQRILLGVAFGGTTVLAMMAPLHVGEGIIAHIGGVVVVLGGLFGGWISAVLAAGAGAAYREFLGGVGAPGGIAGMALSAAVGILFHGVFNTRNRPIGYGAVVLLAGVFPIANATTFLLLPGGTGWELLQRIGLPLVAVQAASVLALGSALLQRQRRLDLTARLQRNEERLRVLTANIPGILFRRKLTPGEKAAYEFIEGNLLREWDVTPEEATRDAASILQFVHPDDFPAMVRSFDPALDDHAPRSLTVRVHGLDGSLRWLQIESLAHQMPGGQWVRDGIMTDITRLKRTEDAARESEARYRLLAENMSDEILRISGTGEILYVSPAVREISGRSVDARIHKAPLENVHPDDAAKCREAWDHAKRERIQTSVVYRVRHQDGHYVWVEAVIRPLGRADTVEHQETVIVVRDIGKRKAMEDQLHQTQRLLSMGQLTGGVAHEFNNLLTVISGNLEFLDGELRDRGELRSLIQLIQRAADRGADLTRQLLAFSRKQPLHPQALNLPSLLKDTEQLARSTLPETIGLTFHFGADPWPAMVDGHQLQNAVLNLIINSRDAMPQGGKIQVTLQNQAVTEADGRLLEVVPGRYVEICVQDTGTGMAPGVLERAVEPFFSTKDVGKGTGLGLSMVHGFALQSGGHLSLTSDEGRGTEVRLLLPAATVPADIVVGDREVGAPLPAQRTILVAEDNPDVLATTARMVRDLGYHTIEAPDGPAALAAFDRAGRVDLLLTDMIMPNGMSGLDLAQAIRSRHPSLKVIYMSGYSESVAVPEGVCNDGTTWLWKPFRKVDLEEALNKIWGTISDPTYAGSVAREAR